MAPVYQALVRSPHVRPILTTSGQHSTMLAQALEAFQMVPEHNLDVMSHDQSLPELTSRVITGASRLLLDLEPDLFLVHGDTTTAFAGALSAFYHSVPIGHVEAGLRTGNLAAPFPEEGNRQLIARMSTLHFAPTIEAEDNLKSEGIRPSSIFVTGNTVVDALRITLDEHLCNPNTASRIQDNLMKMVGFPLITSSYVLVTLHRRESFGEALERICGSLVRLVDGSTEIRLVVTVHPNPNVADVLRKKLKGHAKITLINPVSYTEMVSLLTGCLFVITDSGGIQEEAVTLGKNVVVTRAATERVEGKASGLLHVVGSNEEDFILTTNDIVSKLKGAKSDARLQTHFGDGFAADKIVSSIESFLS